MPKNILPQIPEWIVIAGVIVFGAIVHATAQLKISRDKKQSFTVVDFVILLPLSMFAGGIFGGITYWTAPDDIVLIVLSSAIGAFLGIAGLNKVGAIVLDALENYLKNRK